MANFYPVTIEEMRDFLKKEKGWTESQNGQKEAVFCYQLKDNPHILIKVFSGIAVVSGQSRKCGSDAIRVCAVNTNTNAGWVKSNRVHRVEGWKNNLKERVLKVIKMAKGRLKGEIK